MKQDPSGTLTLVTIFFSRFPHVDFFLDFGVPDFIANYFACPWAIIIQVDLSSNSNNS